MPQTCIDLTLRKLTQPLPATYERRAYWRKMDRDLDLYQLGVHGLPNHQKSEFPVEASYKEETTHYPNELHAALFVSALAMESMGHHDPAVVWVHIGH